MVCLVCRWGSPAAFFITLEWVCFWPKVSQEFFGLRRRSRLPFVVRHPFPVSVGPSPFLGLGWFWSQVGGPFCDSWFWTLLMLGCTFMTPLPLTLLPSLAVGWSRHLLFLGLCLGFFPLASSVGCWLAVVEVYP